MKGYDADLTLRFVRRCLGGDPSKLGRLVEDLGKRRLDRLARSTLFDSADDFYAWMRDHGIVREDRKG